MPDSSSATGTPAASRADRAFGRLAGLDTLRAVAIVAVMLYHLNWRLPHPYVVAGRYGWMGVDLFFVLSGYLIGSQLLKPVQQGRGVDVMGFYRRRAYRILPAYLVVLGLYLFWPSWREQPGMSPLWEFLTFTENLFVDYPKNAAFSHVWSLCIEEHFYLFLPLMVLWLARRPSLKKTVAVMGFFVALGLAARSFALLHYLRPLGPENDGYGDLYIERVYYPTWARLDGLLAGVALALVKIFRPGWWTALLRRGSWLLVLGVALVGMCGWMFYYRFASDTGPAAASTVVGFPLLSLGLALWVLAAADARCWFARCRVPGARVLATLAFSLYLTHKEAAQLAHAWLPALTAEHRWWSAPMYAVSCLAVGAVLYHAVERPFLQLRDRRERRHVPVDVEARVDPAL